MMVQRYNGIEQDPEGVYVMFEDYESLEQQNKNRGAAIVLAQEIIAKNDKRIEELEAACEIIADAFAESDADCADKEDRIGVLEGALREISRWGCIAPEDQRATVDVARAALGKEQT